MTLLKLISLNDTLPVPAPPPPPPTIPELLAPNEKLSTSMTAGCALSLDSPGIPSSSSK